MPHFGWFGLTIQGVAPISIMAPRQELVTQVVHTWNSRFYSFSTVQTSRFTSENPNTPNCEPSATSRNTLCASSTYAGKEVKKHAVCFSHTLAQETTSRNTLCASHTRWQRSQETYCVLSTHAGTGDNVKKHTVCFSHTLAQDKGSYCSGGEWKDTKEKSHQGKTETQKGRQQTLKLHI